MFLIGEIKMFAFTPNPEIWAPCDGRAILINDNAALYSLIGGLYGEDRLNGTFNIPFYSTDEGVSPEYYICLSGNSPDYNNLAIGLSASKNAANLRVGTQER